MPEEKFDPIKEFTNLRDSLSKVVEQSVKGAVGMGAYPALDVYEVEDAVIVRTAPIDGVQPDSVEVSMEDGVLTIKGISVADIAEDTTFIVRERRFGSFSRSVRIPRDVRAEEAQAKFRQGVLTITLPKLADKRPKVIEITPAE